MQILDNFVEFNGVSVYPKIFTKFCRSFPNFFHQVFDNFSSKITPKRIQKKKTKINQPKKIDEIRYESQTFKIALNK